MLYLSGVRTNELDRVGHAGGERGPAPVGLLVTPGTAGFVQPGRQNAYPWVGIDNGMFSAEGKRIFEKRGGLDGFRALVEKCLALWGDDVLFVAVPDVVFDWAGTLARFRELAPAMRTWGVPLAIVLQDGATIADVPWAEVDAVFVGGSTAWKVGPEAAKLAKEARRRGMWAHMGRVNSERRVLIAAAAGCDSVDGTYLKYDNDPFRVVGWAAGANDRLRQEESLYGDEAALRVAAGDADWADLMPARGY